MSKTTHRLKMLRAATLALLGSFSVECQGDGLDIPPPLPSPEPTATPQKRIPTVEQPSIPAKLPLPYLEFEAEAGKLGGGATVSDFTTSAPNPYVLGAEASGRRHVSLNNVGDSVSWVIPQPVNSLVIRYSIPDSPDGGGLTCPLEIHINGILRQSVVLNSKYAWVYGNYTWTNKPGDGNPHKFWDEVNLSIDSLSAGDTLTLKRPQETDAPIQIDLIDVEMVAPPLAQPPGSVSVMSHGAVGDGIADDTQALKNAISAASGGTVWIPKGKYNISSIPVQGVTLQGAGMWHTRFVGKLSQFHCRGGGTHFSDFAVFGETAHRDDASAADSAFDGNPGSGSTLTRIWVERKKCAFWVGSGNSPSAERLVITQCRFRNLMADAVNFYKGTSNSMVDNSQIRYSGEDALASWSPSEGNAPVNHGNIFCNNTIQLPWLASGIAIYGGKDHAVMNNDLYDCGVYSGSGVYVTNNFKAHPLSGSILVSGNLLVRCGTQASDPGGPAGALRVLAWDSPIQQATILFKDNRVRDSVVSGISIQGDHQKERGVVHPMSNVFFKGIAITGGSIGIDIRSQAHGSATFEDVTVAGAPEGLRDNAGADFTIVKGAGNSGW